MRSKVSEIEKLVRNRTVPVLDDMQVDIQSRFDDIDQLLKELDTMLNDLSAGLSDIHKSIQQIVHRQADLRQKLGKIDEMHDSISDVISAMKECQVRHYISPLTLEFYKLLFYVFMILTHRQKSTQTVVDSCRQFQLIPWI